MEEKQLEFIRGLYSKYNVDLSPDKEQKLLQNFGRDFDKSLSLFYQKYNPSKELSEDFLVKARDFSGFSSYSPESEVDFGEIDFGDKDERPSGFFSNMKTHFENLDENVANSFWYMMSAADRGISAGFDSILSNIVGENNYEYGSPNAEVFLKKIQDNREALQPTVGILDEDATVPERVSGALGASTDFLRSIVSGVATGGMAPIIEQSESMYIDALEAKAKRENKSPIELIRNNEDEELEPLLYGAVAGGLEYIGIKGVSNYINSMPKDIKSKAVKGIYSMLKEGNTEYLQGGLEVFNQSRAEGKDVYESLNDLADYSLSREGAETFVAGALGAGVLGAGGRAVKSIISKKEEEIDAINNEEESKEVKPKTEEEIKKEAKQSVGMNIDSSLAVIDSETESFTDPTMEEEMNSIINEFKEAESAKKEEEIRSENEIALAKQAKKKESDKEKTGETKEDDIVDLTETQEELISEEVAEKEKPTITEVRGINEQNKLEENERKEERDKGEKKQDEGVVQTTGQSKESQRQIEGERRKELSANIDSEKRDKKAVKEEVLEQKPLIKTDKKEVKESKKPKSLTDRQKESLSKIESSYENRKTGRIYDKEKQTLDNLLSKAKESGDNETVSRIENIYKKQKDWELKEEKKNRFSKEIEESAKESGVSPQTAMRIASSMKRRFDTSDFEVLEVTPSSVTYTDGSGDIFTYSHKTRKSTPKSKEVNKTKPKIDSKTKKKKIEKTSEKKDVTVQDLDKTSKNTPKTYDLKKTKENVKSVESFIESKSSEVDESDSKKIKRILSDNLKSLTKDSDGNDRVDARSISSIKDVVKNISDLIGKSKPIRESDKQSLMEDIDSVNRKIKTFESVKESPDSIYNSKKDFVDESGNEKASSFLQEVIKSFGLSGKFLLVDVSSDELASIAAKHFGEGTQEYNAIISEQSSDSIGFNLYSPLLDVTVIGFNSKMKDSSVAYALTHEIGHSVERQLYDDATDYQKQRILEDYNKWLKDKGKVKTVREANEQMHNIAGTLASTDVYESRGFPRSLIERVLDENIDKEMFDYLSSFSEYFAESTSNWFLTNNKPLGVVEKFFKGVSDAIKKLINKFNNTFGTQKAIEEFLEERYKFAKDKDAQKVKSLREAYKGRASSIYKEIINTRKMLNSAKSRIKAPKSEADYKEAKKEVKKHEDRINGFLQEIDDIYKDYTEVGKQSKEKFLKDAEVNANKLVEKEIFRDIEDSFNDPFVDYARSNINARAAFIARIAKMVDGKFSTDKEFKDVIKAVNDNLSLSGVSELTKEEIDDVLKLTNQGVIFKIKSTLYSEYRKRPRKDLLNIIKSIDASDSERTMAMNEIANKIADEGYTEENMKQFIHLSFVGLKNATRKELDHVVDNKYAEYISKGNKSTVAKKIMKAKDKENLEAGSSFMESFLGAKKISEGVYSIEHEGVTHKINIFQSNKPYAKGDLVERLGKVYMAKEDIKEGSPFSKKNFDFQYAFHINKPVAESEGTIRGLIDRIVRFFDSLSLRSHGLESLVAQISSSGDRSSSQFESRANKMIGSEGFRRAELNLDKDFNDTVERLYSVAEEVFGLSREKALEKLRKIQTEKVTLKYKDNDGNSVEIPITMGNLMTYYAYLRQPDLAERFESMKDKPIDPNDPSFWNDSKRNAVLDAMPSDNKRFVETVTSKVMSNIFEDLNSAYERMNGVDLVKVENYFPVSSYVKENSTSILDVDIKDVKGMLQTVSSHNLKQRQHNKAALKADGIDFVQTTLRYANKAYHYKNFVEPMRNASKLLQYGDYRSFVEKKFGREFVSMIDHHLNNIAGNGAVNFERVAWADAIRSLSISGALGANLTMIPKQLSSFAAYMNSMNTVEWMSYYATLVANPKKFIDDARAMMNTTFIKKRLESGVGGSPETLNLMLDDIENRMSKLSKDNKMHAMFDKAMRVMYFPTKVGDVGAILLGGAPLWRSAVKEGMKRYNGDRKKALDYAELKLSESTSRTQQSRSLLDQSYWQTSSSINSWFVTFMSTPILYGRIIAGGIDDIRNGKTKKVRKEGLKKVFLFGILLPYLFEAASSASLGLIFGEDEEEWTDNPFVKTLSLLPAALVQHIPILYPAIRYFIDKKFLGKDFDFEVSPVAAIMTEGGSSMIDLMDEMIEEGELDFDDEKTHRDIAKVTRSIGINYGTVRNMKNAWSDVESALNENPALLLGYSPYALGTKSIRQRKIKQGDDERKRESNIRKSSRRKIQSERR